MDLLPTDSSYTYSHSVRLTMDLAHALESASHGEVLKCIDMHTTGEPTRIVYAGFPPLSGTLLSQRDQAQDQYDHLRKRIMLEPRGHYDMYGAILRPSTELVESGQAHIGVLFTHNGGFSTMCGHATIALGRFLVDTHDLTVFPKRNELVVDVASQTVIVNLHAPCGLVRITVPVKDTANGVKSDPSRAVSFLSTPGYAAAINLTIPIPSELRWSELEGRESITLDVSYGGAFYALINMRELGFGSTGLKKADLDALSPVMKRLKSYLIKHPLIQAACQHPEDKRLSYLYSIMLVDTEVGYKPDGVAGSETGLCFFADNQIDRSPTGSCVTARMALAHVKGERSVGQRWAYNSVVSNHFQTGAFEAEIVETGLRVEGGNAPAKNAVVVRVEGRAYYTGTSSFVVEEGDVTSHSGFVMSDMSV